MTARNKILIAICLLLTTCLAFPQLSFAQENGNGGNGGSNADIELPRNRVKGGSLAERSPGLQTSANLATAAVRNDEIVNQFGGVVYTETAPEEDGPLSRKSLIIAALEELFETLNEILIQLGQNCIQNNNETPIGV